MTEQYESHTLRDLTDAQRLAIDALLTGSTDQEAADAAGVTRETVNRWRNHHPEFQAELNRRRKLTEDQHSDIVRQMNDIALEHYRRKMLEGDETFIRDWVRSSGVARTSTAVTGPLDSEEIIKVQVDRRDKRWEDEPEESDREARLFRLSKRRPSLSGVRWEVERELRDMTGCEPIDDGVQPGHLTWLLDGFEDDEPDGA
jgi:hypothetical protein